jgi:hypothetical protein
MRYLTAVQAAEVKLYHNNSEKLATSSSGIDVTGTVTADGLNLDGNIQGDTGQNMQVSAGAGAGDKLDLRAGDDVRIYVDGATAHKLSANFANNGDISFYEDTGTTAKLFWDASAESLGIGTSSPSGLLHIASTGASNIKLEDTDNGFAATELNIENGGRDFKITTPQDTIFVQGSTEAMRILDGGNVGIGTSSPAAPLHLKGPGGCELHMESGDGASTSVIKHNQSTDALEFYPDGSLAMTLQAGNQAIFESNVGIGTSSPSATLEVDGVTNSTYLIAGGDDSSNGRALTFTSSASAAFNGAVHTINAPSSQGAIALATGSTERMRIDSSGNVGINTSSPSSYSSASELVVDTGVGGGITVVSDSTVGGYGALFFADGTTGNQQYRGYVQYNHNNGGSVDELLFGTAGVEAMRIDASGTLLVDKTATGIGTAGIELTHDNVILGTRDGGTTQYLNRLTSDGNIIEFMKDGTTVGSIGTNSSLPYFAGTSIGLKISGTQIRPSNSTGANNDNAVDLGKSDTRFKDLYLSGGVYLGGTGSANLLDDYEEGTFTGAVSDASSGGNESSSVVNGTYVKVGAVVYVQFNVSNIITTGMTAGNDVFITGLPFVTKSVSGTAKYTGTANLSVVTFEQTPFMQVNEGQAYVKILEVRSGAGNDAVVVSQLSSGASDIHGNLVYETA